MDIFMKLKVMNIIFSIFIFRLIIQIYYKTMFDYFTWKYCSKIFIYPWSNPCMYISSLSIINYFWPRFNISSIVLLTYFSFSKRGPYIERSLVWLVDRSETNQLSFCQIVHSPHRNNLLSVLWLSVLVVIQIGR